MEKLTATLLRQLLSYDQKTGIFRWRIRPRQRACNEIAGSAAKGDYRKICIRQKMYKAHRLAWLYMHGSWPDGDVDHINGNKDDNSIDNLRVANKSTNQANSKLRCTNVTGFKGASSPLGGRKKFPARITVNYKSIWLGSYPTAAEAHEAYLTAARFHFGDFARPK